jgi:hypothetical protein
MKTKFKKKIFGKGSKLFTINNFKYEQGKYLLDIGADVYQTAQELLGYDLTKPKKLESFLRKCFRAYYDSKVK